MGLTDRREKLFARVSRESKQDRRRKKRRRRKRKENNKEKRMWEMKEKTQQ